MPIVANLRHDQLDDVLTDSFFESTDAPSDLRGEANQLEEPAHIALTWSQELRFLYRLAKHLKAQREVVRGKPENFNRPDYNFRLVDADGQSPSEPPSGVETVQISERRRGAPLDLIVAEAMILANNTWGGWLAALGVPGIYRSQASMAPGIKVRMSTRALPHAGMGVAHYTWATSPLRRYVDLVNQWQIIACARHGATAALAAPFKPKDTTLLAIISGFDAAYTAYNGFQNGIERFWTLRWLEQNHTTELTAAVMKDGLVRADDLPLVFKALGCESLPRGSHVKVRITGLDEMTLDVHATLMERLDEAAPAEAADGDDDELEAAAAPLALAIDLNDTGDAGDGEAAAAAAPN